MRQKITERLSTALLSWRNAETIDMVEFPFKVVPGNQRDKNHQKMPEVKAFQEKVAEHAREQFQCKATDTIIGARLFVVFHKRSPDLDNIEKSIWDGLKQIAFGDDAVIRYVEKLSVRGDTADDAGFVVELIAVKQKREDIWE